MLSTRILCVSQNLLSRHSLRAYVPRRKLSKWTLLSRQTMQGEHRMWIRRVLLLQFQSGIRNLSVQSEHWGHPVLRQEREVGVQSKARRESVCSQQF